MPAEDLKKAIFDGLALVPECLMRAVECLMPAVECLMPAVDFLGLGKLNSCN